MNNKLLFEKNNSNIVVTIPIQLLKFAAENNPYNKYKILKETEFAEQVMIQLENHLGRMESGLTGLQELLDEAIDKVAESGEDCIVLQENF